MHTRLFANFRALEPLAGHAEAIGLDLAAFESCLEGGTHAAAVRADMALARRAGASGTPSFVLGVSDPAEPGKITGLSFIRGAQPFAAFKTEIDKALESLDSR
jgi:predicted DsbA family dithiol-disulfide isomerase